MPFAGETYQIQI